MIARKMKSQSLESILKVELTGLSERSDDRGKGEDGGNETKRNIEAYPDL